MSMLNEVAKNVSVDDLVVCVFANSDYVPVLDVWSKFFKKSANCKFLVFALDSETREFCVQHGLDFFCAI